MSEAIAPLPALAPSAQRALDQAFYALAREWRCSLADSDHADEAPLLWERLAAMAELGPNPFTRVSPERGVEGCAMVEALYGGSEAAFLLFKRASALRGLNLAEELNQPDAPGTGLVGEHYAGDTLLSLCWLAEGAGPAAFAALLLREGALPNGHPDCWGDPLWQALEHGSADLTRALLDGGADPNLRSPQGWTPLHLLFKLDDPCPAKASALIEAGARMDALDYSGRTPEQAASSDNRALATSLLERELLRKLNAEAPRAERARL